EEAQPVPKFGPPRQGGFGFYPTIFVQYASDTSVLATRLEELATQRDTRLEALERETRASLLDLRTRLFWICLGTFAAVVAGGFVLVHLGLSPLARLSDAVSRVSEKDFRLKVDQQTLPRELKPIAARLSETLEQLQRAFDREKQAA